MEITGARNMKNRVDFNPERDDVLDTVSNWLDHKVALPVELGKEMNTLKSISYAAFRGNPNLRSHAREIACRLQCLSSTLEDVSAALKKEIGSFEAVSCKCGIALLPDEVLLTILEMAIDSTRSGWPWRDLTTTRLSHVDRQFRSAMLSCPRLWTSMTSNRGMVKSCFPRTRGLPLNIYFYCFVMPDECRFDLLLTELLPIAKHWGELSILLTKDDERRYKSLPGQMVYHASVDASILKRLTIGSENYYDVPAPVFDWSQWNCPQLEILDAEYYFPLNLPGLSNVSTVYLTLCVNDANISEILLQLTRMTNMTYLSLELSNTYDDSDIVLFDTIVIPQVRRLQITTTIHFEGSDLSPAHKRSIFSSLFFPGVEELALKINGSDYMGHEYRWDDGRTRDFYYNKEVNRIFRHIDQFPLVRLFKLRIGTLYGDHHDSDGYSKVSIPLNMLPSLKQLIFDSNTRFDIEEPEDPDEIHFEGEDAVAPRVIGNVFPVLESANLEMGEPSAAADWVKWFLHEVVKDRGRWNRLFKLEVVLYDFPGHVLRDRKEYVGEEALEWCDKVVRDKSNEEAQQTVNDLDSV